MPPVATVALLAPLILWRLYSRVKRMVGRQPSILWRHWCAAILLPLLLLVLAAVALRSAPALEALAAGVAGGVLLARWGLRLTRFESGAAGYFYIPSTHIGLALTLLLVARIGYRLLVLHGSGAGFSLDAGLPHGALADYLVASPLTLLVVGLRLGYAAMFAVGLLRWRRAGGVATTPAA